VARVPVVNGDCCLHQGRLRPRWRGPGPHDQPWTRVGSASPRPRQGPSTLERPAPARPAGQPYSGAGTAQW